VDVGANCRKGPGTAYDKTGSFAQGTYVTIVGHNTDSTWWLVLNGSSNCWISATTGHTTGNLSGIPLVEAPPTPTAIAGAGPAMGNPVALVAELSYPSNCTSNALQVAIRVTDTGKGIKSVWLAYRYLGDGGYTGMASTTPLAQKRQASWEPRTARFNISFFRPTIQTTRLPTRMDQCWACRSSIVRKKTILTKYPEDPVFQGTWFLFAIGHPLS
jgi:hypothetical protein